MRGQIREIRIIDLLKYFLLPLLLLSLIWILFGVVFAAMNTAVFIISLAVSVILTYPLLKYFLIGSVLMYKAFAPMWIRNQCRFEPTCSTYMVIALQKYGLIRGFYKGVRRIIRCRPPNGGIDYP